MEAGRMSTQRSGGSRLKILTLRVSLTRMSWMEMTEQGKAMAEVTFTITEFTSSGNTYLKYCRGESRGRDN